MDVQHIAVLGSGTMGHGIAQAAIFAGFEATLYDIAQDLLDRARETIRGNIDRYFVAKGKMTQAEGDAVFSRLAIEVDLGTAVGDADYIIEAVPENMELKKKIFGDLDRFCPAHAILATNTSVLSVTAIAGTTNREDRCIGTHFFNPAALMKLVEVVIPMGVSEETIETTLAVLTKMGKTPVKVKDVPGFIVNRLLCLLYQECAQIVLEGTATAEEVDTAMRLGANHPLGPCELADFGGLDVVKMAQEGIYNYTQNGRDRLNILYRKMIEAGRLGRKNGKGFYDYHADGTKTPFKLF